MSYPELSKAALMEQMANEAPDKALYYASLTWQERLAIANYLNSIVYNYPENEPPKLDKTVFSVRRRKDS